MNEATRQNAALVERVAAAAQSPEEQAMKFEDAVSVRRVVEVPISRKGLWIAKSLSHVSQSVGVRVETGCMKANVNINGCPAVSASLEGVNAD